MTYTRSVIVTGGTINLGYQAALQIAKAHPEYLVVISSRSDKNKAADQINRALGQSNTIFLPLDLSDLANVRQFAKNWAAQERPPIHRLVLNAGLQFPKELTKTKDGLEATFGINHVGHALLFHLLVPYLTEDARIVVTSSGTHDPAQKSGLPDAKYTSAQDLAYPPSGMIEIDGRGRYTSSKLANMLWTYALDRRLAAKKEGKPASPRRTVAAFDPGLMPGTGLAREYSSFERFLWKHVLTRLIWLLRLIYNPNIHTPEESGPALAWAAIAKDAEGKSGVYFEGRKVISSSTDSYNETKQEDLWNWTINFLAQSDEEKEKFQKLE